MFYFALILIAIAIIVMVYGIYLYFSKNQRMIYPKYKELTEYIGTYLAIILTFITIYQADSSIKNSTDDFQNLVNKVDSIIGDVNKARNTLDTVGDQLSLIPTELEQFSKSINSFNNIISIQKKELSQTLIDFNSSIEDFQISVDAMYRRFDRKPELVFDFAKTSTDSFTFIKKVVIKNRGDLLAELYRATIFIPKAMFDKFDTKIFKRTGEDIDSYTYSCDFPPFPLHSNPVHPFVLDIELKLKKPIIVFRVLVYYRAAFGNDGQKDTVLIFHK